MTRPAAPGHGLPGPGQDLFPEQARELGRRMGLVDDEILPLRYTETRSGGATRVTYEPDDEPVRGRIDPVSSSIRATENVSFESSTHIVTVDADSDLDVRDRVRVLGGDWLLNAHMERTDPLVQRFEAERVNE